MQRYNITVPKKYTKNGEEKTSWNRVGTLVKFEAKGEKPEGYILELNMFPDTKFAIFEDVPKEGKTQAFPTIQQDDGGVSDDELPF